MVLLIKLTVQHGPHNVINVIVIKQPVTQYGYHILPGDEVDRPTRPPAPGLQGDLSGEAARREAGNDHQGWTEVMILMVVMMIAMTANVCCMKILQGPTWKPS